MANFERLGGLLAGGNPLFDIGIGLLAASGPRPVGSANVGSRTAEALQFASARQRAAMENQAFRDSLLRERKQAEAQERLSGLLAAQGGEQSEMIGLLAQANPQAFSSALTQGLLSQLFPEQSGFGEKLSVVREAIGRPLTDEEILNLAGSGTTINIGDKLAEPIPVAQIGNVRLPDGRPVPIGTTFDQARQMGAQVVSSEEQKSRTQAEAALGVLAEIEDLALGSGGVFTNVEPGFINRAGAAILHGLQLITQDDPAAARYEDLSKSTLAPFIKLLGETGALAEGDVSRALGLLPRTFPLPDTKEVAQEKLRILREIVERGIRNSNQTQPVAPQAPAIPPPPPGFVLDQ